MGKKCLAKTCISHFGQAVYWLFLVHPTVVLVLLSASVERFIFSHMWDFSYHTLYILFNEVEKEGCDSDTNCESVGGRQLDVCPVVVITDVAALVEGSLMCV